MARPCALSLILAAALAACAAPLPARAQAVPPGAGGASSVDDWEVGGLGVAGAPGASKDEPCFEVREALAGGACDGKLQGGDAIVGFARQPLPKACDVIATLEAAVEAAEATASGDLELLVKRGEKVAPVKVKVAALGPHSKTCPLKCKKCDAIATRALDRLLKMQAADGSFPTELGGENGKIVMTSLGGIALISAGAAPGTVLEEPLSRAIAYVVGHIGSEAGGLAGMPGTTGRGGDGPSGGAANWSQINWQLAYGGMFLAEAATRMKSQDALSKLAEVTKQLCDNQEASGGWAHGPGGPNALGYVELEIMSDFALMELGCARRLKVPFDAKKLAAGLAYVEQCCDGNGGIAYSTRPGQKGFGEAGRTAGAIEALAMCGQRQAPLYSKMGAYLKGRWKDLGSGHVSPTMHTLSGALASWQMGDEDFATYWSIYRPHLMAARTADGGFGAAPTPETLQLKSNSDRMCGPVWMTASDLIVMEIAKKKMAVLTDRR